MQLQALFKKESLDKTKDNRGTKNIREKKNQTSDIIKYSLSARLTKISQAQNVLIMYCCSNCRLTAGEETGRNSREVEKTKLYYTGGQISCLLYYKV